MNGSPHPTAKQIAEYALGRLPAADLLSIESHIDDCSTCQATLKDVASDSDALIQGIRQPPPDDPFVGEAEFNSAFSAIRRLAWGTDDETLPGTGSPTHASSGGQPLGTLRDYELIAKLGQGGMGTVYRARHRRLDRMVALKVLPAERMRDTHAVARFEREMKAIGNLHHPNIVQAFDAGEVDNKHFLVLELLDGVDLGTLIQQEGSLDSADACELIRQAAIGLHYAHENGLVHRDVKPSNLMLTREGTVKLLDLGLARLLEDSGSRDSDPLDEEPTDPSAALLPETEEASDVNLPVDSTGWSSAPQIGEAAAEATRSSSEGGRGSDKFLRFQRIGDELTGTDQVMGTPDYMAPEQCTDSRHVDIRSDIYSLGATLYKLLTGHAPYSGSEYDTLPKKIKGLLAHPIPPVTDQRPELPDELVGVVERMLAKDPASRFATPRDVAEALAPLATGHNVWRFLAGAAPAGTHSDVITPGYDRESTTAFEPTRPTEKARLGRAMAVAGVALAASLALFVLLSEWAWRGDNSNPANSIVESPEEVVPAIQRNGKPLIATLSGHEGPVLALAASEHGNRLVSAGFDGQVRIYDTRSGHFLSALRGHRGPVTAVAISADGAEIASGGRDETVRIWNASTGESLETMERHTDWIEAVAYSADGKWFATTSRDHTTRLAALPDQDTRIVVGVTDETVVRRYVKFAPDGSLWAGPGLANSVHLYEGGTSNLARKLSGHQRAITDVDFSFDSSLLVSASEDATARIWEVASGDALAVLTPHEGPVRAVAFSPNGDIVATVGDDLYIRLWSVADGALLAEQAAPTARINAVTFFPAGDLLATAGGDGQIAIWHVPATLAAGVAKPVDESHFLVVSLDELEPLDNGLAADSSGIPSPESTSSTRSHLRPYVVLDGPGEAYLSVDLGADALQDPPADALKIAISVPSPREVAATVFLPQPSEAGYRKVNLVVPEGRLSPHERSAFFAAKRDHYAGLLHRGLPGAAWFRYQMRAADAAHFGEPQMEAFMALQVRSADTTLLADTFGLLAGGLPMSELLDLDFLPTTTSLEAEKVDIGSLAAITAPQIDWTSHLPDAEPRTDPLAAYIPEDQHAIFFSSFQGLVDTVDRLWALGTPLRQIFEPRGEDALTLERYQQQLGIRLNTLARKLGPQFVKSVAVTGGDPYLRTGSDFAILFEPTNRAALEELLAAQISLEVHQHARVLTQTGSYLGVDYTHYSMSGGRDPTVRSYQATVGDVIVVTNSRAQLDRIIRVAQGNTAPLAAAPSYRFFRDRYPPDSPEESGLLVVSDKTIQRWISPRWRIAASRRLRAAAAIADAQASHAEALLGADSLPDDQVSKFKEEVGMLTVTPNGVWSDEYGGLGFLTPVSELNVNRVTPEEAGLYDRWRQQYEAEWNKYVDPVAVRFALREDRLETDMTVMPLSLSTNYNWLLEGLGRGAINPAVTDRHAESLLHVAAAVDLNGPLDAVIRASISGLNLDADPLDWFGGTASLYVDGGAFWQDLARAEDKFPFMRRELDDLPVALVFELADRSKLTRLISELRMRIEQQAPKVTEWQTRYYRDQPYVRVTWIPIAAGEDAPSRVAVYYYAGAHSLVITPNERQVFRTIDRIFGQQLSNQPTAPPEPPEKPWLGGQFGLSLERGYLSALTTLTEADYDLHMKHVAWNNLPILNDWKRRYPERDPVEVHETLWRHRLVCPGGGEYRWNDEYQTMESTVYGHPGEPRRGPLLPDILARLRAADVGVTIEEGGVRVRAELSLDAEPSN